jgi:hypothetical protein
MFQYDIFKKLRKNNRKGCESAKQIMIEFFNFYNKIFVNLSDKICICQSDYYDFKLNFYVIFLS